MKARLFVVMLTCVVAACFVAAPGCSADDGEEIRVGTFSTRAVALAWGRSDAFQDWVGDLRIRASEAEEAEDTALVEEIGKEAAAQQDRMHRQVFGEDPIDDVLERMLEALPGIARAAGVDIIDNDLLYYSRSVELVDITDEMAAHWEPSEETVQMIGELLETEPVDVDDLDPNE